MPQILVIDDHPLIITALDSLISSNLGSSYRVFSATNNHETIELVKNEKFDLIIMDIFLPDVNTQNLLYQILRIQADSRVLIYSSGNEEIYALHYVKQGAYGFVGKGAAKQKVVKAMQVVLSGRKYLSPYLLDQMVDLINNKNTQNPFANLSSREMEVAKFLVQGKGISEIAEVLRLHTSTIGTQKSRIFKKLGVINLKEFEDLARLNSFDIT